MGENDASLGNIILLSPSTLLICTYSYFWLPLCVVVRSIIKPSLPLKDNTHETTTQVPNTIRLNLSSFYLDYLMPFLTIPSSLTISSTFRDRLGLRVCPILELKPVINFPN